MLEDAIQKSLGLDPIGSNGYWSATLGFGLHTVHARTCPGVIRIQLNCLFAWKRRVLHYRPPHQTKFQVAPKSSAILFRSLRDLSKPSRQTARARRGLRSLVSTTVDTGIIDRRSTTWTRQNAKQRLNLQKHRKQEMRSASGKYSWTTYNRSFFSYSLTTGAVVTN